MKDTGVIYQKLAEDSSKETRLESIRGFAVARESVATPSLNESCPRRSCNSCNNLSVTVLPFRGGPCLRVALPNKRHVNECKLIVPGSSRSSSLKIPFRDHKAVHSRGTPVASSTQTAFLSVEIRPQINESRPAICKKSGASNYSGLQYSLKATGNK